MAKNQDQIVDKRQLKSTKLGKNLLYKIYSEERFKPKKKPPKFPNV